jgi:hypothetical protein
LMVSVALFFIRMMNCFHTSYTVLPFVFNRQNQFINLNNLYI